MFYKSKILISGVTLWCCASMIVLTLFESFGLETYGFLLLTGFALLVEYISPRFITPEWYSRIQYIIYLSLFLAMVYALLRILPFITLYL